MANRRKFILALLILAGVAAALVAVVIWLAGDAEALVQPDERPILADVHYNSDTYTVEGRVSGSEEPQQYHALLFIETEAWFVKPSFSPGSGEELSPVSADGRFAVRAYHPSAKEQDLLAHRYAVLLMPPDFAGIDNANAFEQARLSALDTIIGEVPTPAESEPEPPPAEEYDPLPAESEENPLPEESESDPEAGAQPTPAQPAESRVENVEPSSSSPADDVPVAFAEISYDKDFFIRGRVQGLDNPANYRVLGMIRTEPPGGISQFYAKPDFVAGKGRELTTLDDDGRFAIRAYHPGAYESDTTLAVEYAVFLVPADFTGLTQVSHYDEAEAASVIALRAPIP